MIPYTYNGTGGVSYRLLDPDPLREREPPELPPELREPELREPELRELPELRDPLELLREREDERPELRLLELPESSSSSPPPNSASLAPSSIPLVLPPAPLSVMSLTISGKVSCLPVSVRSSRLTASAKRR
jgi:hypothetical protein